MDQNPYAAPAVAEPRPSAARQSFKFRYVDEQGHELGSWNKKGTIQDDQLVLDKDRIPILSILHTMVRLNRLVLVIATAGEPHTLVIALKSGGQEGRTLATALKQEIDQTRSSYWAQRRREELKAQGRMAQFRAERCPYCGATVELTGFAPTPQVYCSYCESVVTLGDEAPSDEPHYHVCDRCGFYSRPAVFVSTTIIFLIRFVWWSSRSYFMCHACMRGEAWKSVFRNVWTLVGVPFAGARLMKAYFGGSARSATFAGLDTANQHARKLRAGQAEDLYQTILVRLPRAAGIHHNRALAYSLAGDWNNCLAAANAAWADCSNYSPVVPLARQALESLGRAAEANALTERWAQR